MQYYNLSIVRAYFFFSRSKSYKCRKNQNHFKDLPLGCWYSVTYSEKITFITYIFVTKYEKLKIQWLNEIFDTSKLSVRAYENISVEK